MTSALSQTHETIQVDCPAGGFLRGDLFYSGTPGTWAVVYVHGLGSVRDGDKSQALQAACARRGHTFAAFDFRGHGQSSGTMVDLRAAGLLQDLNLVTSFLKQRGVSRLCPVGSSMGAWASAWYTVQRPEIVPACVLVAPAFGFPRGIWARLEEEQQRAWQQSGRFHVQNDWLDADLAYALVEEADQFPLAALVQGWHTPLLIFHGWQDDVVPCHASLKFLERSGYPEIELRLFKKGDHRLTDYKELIAESACDFFCRYI